MVSTIDICVVGGGPAGLATAIACRQRGLEVAVVDGACFPIDKACGEGLMPDGIAALGRLGISFGREEGYRFRGIRFVSGNHSVDASFPSGSGIGLRRTVLHRLMAAEAEKLGIRLHWQRPITGLDPRGVRLGNTLLPCRWIVGADGGQSLVRRWAGLDHYCSDKTRYAFRRHYRIRDWPDCMELHWGPKCQIYVTPVSEDEICVALISQNPQLRLDDAIRLFPALSNRLQRGEPSSGERGAISSTRTLRHVYRGNVVLVGDASGTVDAVTGEGLCLAFRQAQVLSECFLSGDLNRYQREHTLLSRRPVMMARAMMLALDWKEWLRTRVMRALAAEPRLFSQMLATHLGEALPRDILITGLSLGRRIVSV
jgi:menaquinone-9 beta-reductase